MVSSAVYRYFPSRDDLLTALIIDAYDAVGERAEAAERDAGSRAARRRGSPVCEAVHAWALANAHEYALIYGSPVPGYAAPEATIDPASRLRSHCCGCRRRRRRRRDRSGESRRCTRTIRADFAELRRTAAPDMPERCCHASSRCGPRCSAASTSRCSAI